MRGSLAMLAFLLLIVATLHSEADKEPVQLKPIACCFKYTLRKIPIRFVADYSRTHKQCSSPGIILHTRRGRQICANPSDAWVQEYISNLDNSKGANMA
ncbi:C-C motif chemokine 4-like [Lynx rufus]|uniref:C-C motif chemokine 4-like n=1 Tax=Lynx rufus TaxID=61384 RepID=UPI001F125E94|nr:C-C motif chemokine 4-like [Lynx rufus]